ncbi:phosphoribosyl-ATP diphosphatase [Pelagibacteraceae bacterium]|nr:phosphoribosyl-ATP diphosphatase [Pelagibacteraceae bacterium]
MNIEELYTVIEERIKTKNKKSYTNKLLKLGPKAIAQKMGEETTELIIDYLKGSKKRTIEEAADVIYHLLVLLKSKINEKVFRGQASDVKEVFNKYKEAQKGEFVVVVEGYLEEETSDVDLKKYKNEVDRLLTKFSLTDVVQIVHKLTGIRKKIVYSWILNLN